jgi:NCAIR mutase (PurE)-related protein
MVNYDTITQVNQPPTWDLGFARLDLDRLRRTGDPEVVLASHKTPEQTVRSLRHLSQAHPEHPVLATRCGRQTRRACARELPGAVIDDVGQTVILGPVPEPSGLVAVVTAGTSDLPVAHEALATVQVYGAGSVLVARCRESWPA